MKNSIDNKPTTTTIQFFYPCFSKADIREAKRKYEHIRSKKMRLTLRACIFQNNNKLKDRNAM